MNRGGRESKTVCSPFTASLWPCRTRPYLLPLLRPDRPRPGDTSRGDGAAVGGACSLIHEMIHATDLYAHDTDPDSVFSSGSARTTLKPVHADRLAKAFFAR